MRNLLKGIVKLNIWFCAGILVVDTYAKVCDIHATLTNAKK